MNEHGDDNEMQAGQGSGQVLICQEAFLRSVVACKLPEAGGATRAALDDQAAGRLHEALLRFEPPEDPQFNALLAWDLRDRVVRIALVSEYELHCLTGYVLNLTRELRYLCALVFAGWRNVHRERQLRRVDGYMSLAALLPLASRKKSRLGMTVVTRARPAFACGLQCGPIQDHRTGRIRTLLCHARHKTQIIDRRLEATCVGPSLRLLVDLFPWRKAGRRHSPRFAGSCHPARRAEHFAQLISPLQGVFVHQGQVRIGEGSFLARNIHRVWLAFCHPDTLPGPTEERQYGLAKIRGPATTASMSAPEFVGRFTRQVTRLSPAYQRH